MSYGKEFSTPTLTVAEYLEGLEDVRFIGSAYRAARKIIAGSDSSAYKAATWTTAKNVVGVHELPSLWRKGKGNPEAGYLPRTWKKAIVLGAGRSAMTEAIDLMNVKRKRIKSDHPGFGAVAYDYKDATHVGILHGSFGEIETSGADEKTYAAAMREGRRPIVASLGIWHPDLKTLFVPEWVEVVDDLVPTSELAELYPGVPLV